LQAGVASIAEAFLDGFQPIAGDAAIGVCVVVEPGRAPLVLKRLPPGRGHPAGSNPTRLFSGLPAEHIVDLRDGYGSTLHVASFDAELDTEVILLAEQAASPLCSALSHGRAFAASQRPVEQIDSLRAQVIQAEKLASLGQIVAGFVHELNNPLTSIIAYTDYLKRRSLSRAEGDPNAADEFERLRRIGEAADRILKFSRDLVAYARPSRNVPAPVDLQEVVQKALVFCEHELQLSGVKVTSLDLDALPAVRGNRGQLTQVFVNLFTNAAHAMRANGGELRITASTSAASDSVVVDVADQGVGIPKQDLAQIFEPFFTTKSDGQGSGLGLSIVNDIVRSHGGTLKAESEPGHGTVFRVELPLAARPSSLRP
jgi:signal transduction histidine kinase